VLTHELVNWNSILLDLSQVFYVTTPLVKTVQEFWHKMLLFVPSSGNKGNEVYLGGPMKQVALQITEKLKIMHFAKKLQQVKTLLRSY
jgi:ATP binding cassette subfamily A (ABC1) protein 13